MYQTTHASLSDGDNFHVCGGPLTMRQRVGPRWHCPRSGTDFLYNKNSVMFKFKEHKAICSFWLYMETCYTRHFTYITLSSFSLWIVNNTLKESIITNTTLRMLVLVFGRLTLCFKTSSCFPKQLDETTFITIYNFVFYNLLQPVLFPITARCDLAHS